jgi:hypothetical protein
MRPDSVQVQLCALILAHSGRSFNETISAGVLIRFVGKLREERCGLRAATCIKKQRRTDTLQSERKLSKTAIY